MKIAGETLRKCAVTAAALAVTAGTVLLLRFAVRSAVLGGVFDGDAGYMAAPIPLEPAPKAYDLAKLVPDEFRMYTGGVSVDESSRTMSMPVDLAERISDEQSVAAGWEAVNIPMARLVLSGRFGEKVWKRPDGAFVFRRVEPVDATSSRVQEYVVPIPLASQRAVPADGHAIVLGAVSATGALARLRLPQVISDVTVGGLFMAFRIARGNGTAFQMVTMLAGTPENAARRFREAAIRAGWRIDPSGAMAAKANLSVFVTFQPFGETATCCTYRFADDENLERNMTLETEGRTNENER